MARTNHPPPRLTPALCAAIEEKTAGIHDPVDAPASPLDWIGAYAGVKRLTIRRWMREASAVRRSGVSGPIASKWTRFADAVDALVVTCANTLSDKIGELAHGGEKRALDALLALQKRQDRHEAELDAVDLDVGQDESVAHIPQAVMDMLTDEQIQALTTAQETIAAAQALVDGILTDAAEHLVT